MRKLLLVCLIALLAVPTVFAARKKDKAGKVTDYVYTDKKYNFSLSLNDEWKYKIQKNKKDFRLVLTQIKYGIPSAYASAEDYTKIPRMVVFVVESKLSPKAFIDSLLSSSYKSKAKKTVLKECEILNLNSSSGFTAEKLISRKSKALKVDGKKGYFWTGQVQYTNEVSISASSKGAKRVKSSYGGAITVIKNGDKLILFHVISEWDYFNSIFSETMKIIKSLKWK